VATLRPSGERADGRGLPRYGALIEGGPMPDKSPQKPSAKKPGKSLKEKRKSKRTKNAKSKPAGT
jgi:hypothetical protein